MRASWRHVASSVWSWNVSSNAVHIEFFNQSESKYSCFMLFDCTLLRAPFNDWTEWFDFFLLLCAAVCVMSLSMALWSDKRRVCVCSHTWRVYYLLCSHIWFTRYEECCPWHRSAVWFQMCQTFRQTFIDLYLVAKHYVVISSLDKLMSLWLGLRRAFHECRTCFTAACDKPFVGACMAWNRLGYNLCGLTYLLWLLTWCSVNKAKECMVWWSSQ